MNNQNIYRLYFEWLCNIVNIDSCYSQINYTKLLEYLHSVEFTYIIPTDKNRASDGINLRYLFANTNGYTHDEINEMFSNIPCTVLEMMIGLSYKLEHDIMSDYRYGNRETQWFWNMVSSLQLGNMDDEHFDENYTRKCLVTFLNREYSYNGVGGLFTIDNAPEDLRNIEIWTQSMWFLNTVCEFRI